MSNPDEMTIEFVGGPFDGHMETRSIDETWPSNIVWLVSDNVFRLLRGESHQLDAPITSVAVYQWVQRETGWQYVFAAAMSPESLREICAGGFESGDPPDRK